MRCPQAGRFDAGVVALQHKEPAAVRPRASLPLPKLAGALKKEAPVFHRNEAALLALDRALRKEHGGARNPNRDPETGRLAPKPPEDLNE